MQEDSAISHYSLLRHIRNIEDQVLMSWLKDIFMLLYIHINVNKGRKIWLEQHIKNLFLQDLK
jgi:hypothetical protein